MLGGGVDHDVRAELVGALKEGGGEDVVDDHERPRRVGQVADRAQVDDVQHRVGRGLQQDHGGFLGQGVLPGGEVGAVDEDGGDAVLGQEGGVDPVAGAEQRAGGDHAVAGFELAQHGGVHGGHAGGGAAAGLGAFDLRQPGFQHVDGGVGEAGILVVRDLVGEDGLGQFGVVVDEAGG